VLCERDKQRPFRTNFCAGILPDVAGGIVIADFNNSMSRIPRQPSVQLYLVVMDFDDFIQLPEIPALSIGQPLPARVRTYCLLFPALPGIAFFVFRLSPAKCITWSRLLKSPAVSGRRYSAGQPLPYQSPSARLWPCRVNFLTSISPLWL